MPRQSPGSSSRGVLIALLLSLACTSVPPHPQIDALESGFSGRLARAHWKSIDGFYPRYPGSREDSIVRSYLAREFRRVGAEVRVLADGDRRHLIAELQGASDDVVWLVAAYPSLRSADWVDDSGAAILLELARVFGRAQPPYSLGFALAETRPGELAASGDSLGPDGNWAPLSTAAAALARLSEAGDSLARGIEAEGGADRVRAVIVFDTTARGRPTIARDLRSHPEFRRLFWLSAARLGFGSMFPTDIDWTSPDGLQLGFREHSMDRVLALVHPHPHPHPQVEGRASSVILPVAEVSPGIFESIGLVSVDGLSELMRRFEKIDAFLR